MIAVIDYGMGNLHSLQKALLAVGAESFICASPDKLASADKVILPGVGAFPDAMKKLDETGLGAACQAFAKTGAPLMGICLGMQLLFSGSTEYGYTKGLDLIPGEISLMEGVAGKIPHMGWNTLNVRKRIPLLEGADGKYVYFVHSYWAKDAESEYAAGVTDYGVPFCSVAAKDNVMCTQFHPEKSGETGLRILKNFVEL